MDKKTIWSVVICFVVIFAMTFFVTSKQDKTQIQPNETVQELSETVSENKKDCNFKSLTKAAEKTFTYETDVFNITFDTKGASIASIELKQHASTDGKFPEMIFKGNKNDDNAFLMYWGEDLKNPVLDAFSYSVSGDSVVFKNTFADENGRTFDVVKTFQFKKADYLIRVNVQIEGDGFDAGDYAYTLAFEPQVGPSFESIKSNNRYDYRHFYVGLVKSNGKVKRSMVTLSKSGDFFTTRDLNWISLTSKYFTIIARPENTDAEYKYHAVEDKTGDIQTDSIYVSVPDSEKKDNTVYFYCGPQLKKYLGSYYNGVDNEWGLRNYNLDDAMESGSVLGWLEILLKWCLQVLNKVVPNYGIDIIILTLILKVILWPLQKKSTESTAKMGTVSKEVEAIKNKYPTNTQKQNEEMQKLYKEKGINPMGGCLPLLIQFPILIAFYGLLNKHFELRGAMFIPGWIPDLSVPETVATLKFAIPLLGNQIHLLPIIYTASMIFSMKYTQASTQNAGNGKNMWFMTWGMPIMFFFILYSAPSGLLLYWTTQNALSILQQVNTNRKMAKYGPDYFIKKNEGEEKKQPKAVLKYQEKLKKLENAKKEEKK